MDLINRFLYLFFLSIHSALRLVIASVFNFGKFLNPLYVICFSLINIYKDNYKNIVKTICFFCVVCNFLIDSKKNVYFAEKKQCLFLSDF